MPHQQFMSIYRQPNNDACLNLSPTCGLSQRTKKKSSTPMLELQIVYKYKMHTYSTRIQTQNNQRFTISIIILKIL